MRGLMTVGAFLTVALLLAAPVAMPTSGYEAGIKAQVPSSHIRYDGTVTLGNALTAIAFLVGLGSAYAAFKARLAALEVKVDALWSSWLADHRRDT